MSHVLVHVAGDTLLRGSRKLYEVRAPGRKSIRLRASSTALPVSMEALGRGKADPGKLKMIVPLPHSLVTHAEKFWRLPRMGEGVEEWILDATRRLVVEFPRLLVKDVNEELPGDFGGLLDGSPLSWLGWSKSGAPSPCLWRTGLA